MVARIRHADYAGDRVALRALLEELQPGPGDPRFASRIHYWRGFAWWRRAFNGFNQSPNPPDLGTDLDDAEPKVIELGATKAEHQPGTTFRVFLDPAGHPFCLCVD